MSDLDDIQGKYGGISGKYGGISGGPNEMIERAVLEGRLIDEIGCLQIKVRRLERDLVGIAGSLTARLEYLEGKFQDDKPPAQREPNLAALNKPK